MADPTGQVPGHAAGFTWGDLLATLVAAHGTLAAVAWRLVEQAPGDDVASVERALRRLRRRGQLDGGLWGQRLLRTFAFVVRRRTIVQIGDGFVSRRFGGFWVSTPGVDHHNDSHGW